MKVTSCKINNIIYTQDGSNPIFTCNASMPTLKYNIPQVPIYNSGLFYYPIEGENCLIITDNTNRYGVIVGYSTPISTNSIMEDMQQGEMAIYNRGNFRYSVKAKLDAIIATFQNSSDEMINSNVTIGQNVVSILQEICSEIISLTDYINNTIVATSNNNRSIFNTHIHSGNGQPPTTFFSNYSNYTNTSGFTNSNNFITQSPSQMYVNNDGTIFTP